MAGKKDMAGKKIAKTLRDFDGHNMTHGHPDADDSARGLDHAHRSDLKRKAEGISRSLSELFAFLTHGTASLEEAKKLLSIITNVRHHFIYVCYIIAIVVTVAFYHYFS